ncbi:MAG: DUF1934 domain-containing protein [Clostridia bacterium]|nr:DUF1934 domain-containing protein [Clostridia bacterium]
MKEQIIPVLVTLSGTSDASGQDDTIRVMTTGQLRKTPAGFMLRYQETQTDEGDGSVMTQDIILNMQPGRVSMTRLGDYGTTMVFVKDTRFEGKYRTPFGELDMALFATQVQTELSPEKGMVHLKYQLDLQGSFAAMNTLHLEYAAGGSKPC